MPFTGIAAAGVAPATATSAAGTVQQAAELKDAYT